LIPFAPFARLVREIAQELRLDLNFKVDALLALQESAESVLITEFMS
jgi:histone H3/H4